MKKVIKKVLNLIYERTGMNGKKMMKYRNWN